MLIRVLEIIKAIDSNQPIPRDAGAWLARGFIRCMQEGELLHKTLNLSRLKYQYLLSIRDKHLYAAWLLTDETLSDWQRAGELIIKIERFKLGRWSKVQFLAAPPSNVSPLNRCLFYALKTGIKIPTTVRQVNNIVKSIRKVNFHNPVV